MDPGHYGLQQGWDNDSALEGYGTAHEPDFRVGGTFNERRFLDERYSKEDFYPREAFHHENLNRENYAPPTSTSGLWPQSRKRSYKEEYAINRESRTHDSYHDLDAFNDHDIDAFQEFDRFHEDCSDLDNFSDHRYERPSRLRSRDRDEYTYDDYEYRSGIVHHKREIGRERDYEYGRHSYDSDYERGSREGNWRRHESRDRERDNKCSSREREQSPHRRYERSRSRGRDDHPRSRSPRGSSHGRNHREHSCDGRHERRRDQDEKRERLNYSMAPSATVVVKGLSHKTTEDDLYQILAEWGPLRHIRVIKERSSGISRGFAFIDFPSVGAAQAMMDKIEDVGLFVDERKLFFEYSSKPTGVGGGTFGIENFGRSGHYNNRSITMPSDWMCTICGCVNFARRTSCFQCNEARTDDAPMADISLTNPSSLGKRGQEAGPTHVLVVRGLDENADEEMLRYEFSKHAPVKDLRLVRDKFTHVSRGFAFIHFHSVEDATKALQATHGTTLEKNGQTLRVAYAKSILGPGSGSSGSSQSSSLAAAAIEAAAFAQQYDAVGWAPKEFNPGDKQSGSGQVQEGKKVAVPNDGLAPQSGFVWDQASGYYYDAASGFYYDGNTGLYYDGNSGVWYTYDHQLQQYIPCTDQCDNTTSGKESESSKALDGSNNRKIVICAPAATVTSVEKVVSLPDVVQAAATAAIAAEKKEKEKAKEIKLASKSSILANKKKMNNVLTLWKQRSHEGQATHIALPDDNQQFASADDRPFTAAGHVTKSKPKMDVLATRENPWFGSGVTSSVGSESPVRPQPVNNSLGGTLMGIIRGSGSGVAKFNNMNLASGIASNSPAASGAPASSLICDDLSSVVTPFKTNVTALGSQAPLPTASGGGKRRFSEMPQPNNSKEQLQPTTYRDRAAERRSLYGSSSSLGDNLSDIGFGESNREFTIKKGSSDMPFPPGVGGGRPSGDSNISTYEVITADRAIDENNVGNRMLRSMGWQEGLGLGKDGSGMTEPVQAQAVEHRAGLGSQQKLDPNLEVQAGDSYKTLIHKKALARFREMS